MNIRQTNPIFEDNVVRKSSIWQHKDLLSVMKSGEWCPLVYDVIDGVECGKIKSHKATLRIKDGLNYTFPVGTCTYTSDIFYLSQKDKTELRVLPDYYGTGFYETHERKNVFTNAGPEALGNHQEKTLRVGKDYVMAKKILKAVE